MVQPMGARADGEGPAVWADRKDVDEHFERAAAGQQPPVPSARIVPVPVSIPSAVGIRRVNTRASPCADQLTHVKMVVVVRRPDQHPREDIQRLGVVEGVESGGGLELE